MKISRTSRALFLAFLLAASSSGLRAFVTEDLTWPKGSSVVMHLGLGPASLPLQDGFATWDASAADAVAVWNGYLDFITFSFVSTPTVPQGSDDGINSVFFSNTIFGDSFDESTIAVTVIESTDNATVTGEADVIVNNAFRYDSYRGPQQSDASGEIFDLHRVILHEFGHVLGLDHITLIPPGQALMEPFISDMDHPTLDDVGGVRFLYGAEFEREGVFFPALEYVVRVGDSFDLPSLTANNSPTSYSVVGLPPGLTMDAATGAISGKVTTPGGYDPILTAHGAIADAYASFSISVFGFNEVPGLLSIIGGFSASYLIGDPNRPRIYAATDQGIDLINTDNNTVTLVSPGHDLPDKMSISADGSLLFFRAQIDTTLHRLDLETLTELSTLTIPSGYSQVVEGLDNRAYTSGVDGVYQIDVSTGAVELTFGPTPYPQIEITPDRKTLIVTQTEKSVSTYDISTASPTLIATHEGVFNFTVPAPDNSHVYSRDLLAQNGPLVDLPLPSLTPSRVFGAEGTTAYISVGPDGSIYQTRLYVPSTVSIFDSVSLQLSGELDMTHPPFNQYDASRVLFDNAADNFFVSVAFYGQTEIWTFSIDFASFPPPDPVPTQNLLNISTRARSGFDADATIGGFIIQGDLPKEVVVRAIGPSLPVSGALSDPILDLYDSNGKLLETNDNWVTNRLAIIGSHVPPASEREAAILLTLEPGAYTAVVHDAKGQVGSALIEIYDLAPSDSLLANISTRGKVGTGDDVMIGGFIIGGNDPAEILIRAIGPSLSELGVVGALADPVLELHDSPGQLIATNDNWRSTQQTEIAATGIPPDHDNESAVLITLTPGPYTAIVRGQADSIGIALVEVYNLGSPSAARK